MAPSQRDAIGAEMQRLQRVRLVLNVVLGFNLAVALAKFAVGWLTQSLTIAADSFHSLLDGASNVVGLVGASLALQPPDVGHRYGHQKGVSIAAAELSHRTASAHPRRAPIPPIDFRSSASPIPAGDPAQVW